MMRFARPIRRRCWCGMLLALAGCWHVSSGVLLAADEQDAPQAATLDLDVADQQVDRLIAQLDDSEFATRRDAALQLEQLANQPPWKAFLSRRLRRALLSDATSFEVRSHLERLVRLLPPASTAGESKPDASQIPPLLDQLGSDSYAQRDHAARSLQAMLAHVELIAPLWLELKRRVADRGLSPSGRRSLQPLFDAAHEAWLLADPAKVPLPKPPVEQIVAWINDAISLDETETADRLRREQARREVLDLIARDDTRATVLGIVRETIAASDDSAANAPLQELLDFARPAMAAEVWSRQTHLYQQYLIIGMPQYNDTTTGRRATLFDRIDDQTAHCVSGNALTQGDYPVRVAIPHPQAGQETMYYLTCLSTPRRRLAYEYHLKRDERSRLQEISARTLDYFLQRQTPLSETEVLMLAQLDPRAVSRFVGGYFQTIKNSPLITTLNDPTSQPTVYAGICAIMSRSGTREAVPALERLARSGELGQPNSETRLDVAWVAALAIAQRDPWPEVDHWLADLIPKRQALTSDPDRPPELGASAAGMLLDRHGASTGPFGLETAGESVTDSFQFIGYRFNSERDRQDVQRWWKKQQALTAAARAARLEDRPAVTVPSIRPDQDQRNPAER